MVTYKGTDKDMKCHGGFQYKLGEKYTDDGAIRCGDKGFHSCECPLDVLTYFPPTGGNRYFLAEASGEIDKRATRDTKIASSEIILNKEIDLAGLINAQIKFVIKSADKIDERHHIHAAAQGDCGHAAAQGDYGHAAAQGGAGHAVAQGDYGHAVAQGDYGHAVAQGDEGRATAHGTHGHAVVQGNFGHAEVHGKDAIAASFGVDGTALAGQLGDWIVLAEWEGDSVKRVKAVVVDGDLIKPNVKYKLVNGDFLEVKNLD